MRILGILTALAGILLLLVSCGIDTTVEAHGGTRVINFQRVAQQASTERWGFGLAILGVVMIGVSRRPPKDKPDPTRSVPEWLGSDRPRPPTND